jgi:hypothetical protein
MKRAVHVLAVGCALGVIALSPVLALGLAPSAVSAAPALALVSGTVKDDGGRPLAGAIVALLEVAFNGRELKSVKTNSEGKFSAEILPGSYRLRAAAEGFRPVLARVALEGATKLNYDFALKRVDTIVDQRGDRDDSRWIGRSVPRHVLHLDAPPTTEATETAENTQTDAVVDRFTEYRPSFHGMMQLVATSSAFTGPRGQNFFGTNFAVSGSLGGNFEMALIGQRGTGYLAPQRLEAIATMRPAGNHQVTASIGYGSVTFSRRGAPEMESGLDVMPLGEPAFSPAPVMPTGSNAVGPGMTAKTRQIDQVSVSAIGQWQVFQPLLVIYGFDYARFVGSASRQRDSILPRFAFQYSPNAHWRVNAAMTPGSSMMRRSPESFDSENLQASFETQAAETAFDPALVSEPELDRSRRFEVGIERIFKHRGDQTSSLEASAFYDIIAGHGLGVLALPLEVSPETQAAFAQVADQVTAMQGAARGVRVMYARRFRDYASASVGYSLGRGSRLNDASVSDVADLIPSRLVRNGYFQVATAKLDLDFTPQTGTRVSTVVRLSPDAVIFAIDPFAGRLSVYDPNLNIYVTQDLPSFGLPLKWQAIIDVRNLLNQLGGVDDGDFRLVAARNYRTVRGGVAFRW